MHDVWVGNIMTPDESVFWDSSVGYHPLGHIYIYTHIDFVFFGGIESSLVSGSMRIPGFSASRVEQSN